MKSWTMRKGYGEAMGLLDVCRLQRKGETRVWNVFWTVLKKRVFKASSSCCFSLFLLVVIPRVSPLLFGVRNVVTLGSLFASPLLQKICECRTPGGRVKTHLCMLAMRCIMLRNQNAKWIEFSRPLRVVSWLRGNWQLWDFFGGENIENKKKGMWKSRRIRILCIKRDEVGIVGGVVGFRKQLVYVALTNSHLEIEIYLRRFSFLAMARVSSPGLYSV